ncbi:MAG: hypothetical protein IJ225_04885 [Solobacterium sp.]|nr:hypothetical protein [Solobacterium sp.]
MANAKYSRTAKYEDLRNRLQSDSESSIQTPDLSQYEQRLNRIAPAHFDAPEVPAPSSLDSVHARRAASYPVTEEAPAAAPAVTNAPVEETAQSPAFSSQFFKNNANYTTAFNNEYIDEYIKEVKKYNIDQGNALSANTDLDILRNLRGETPQPAPRKPYPDEDVPVATQVRPNPRPVVEPETPAVREPDTADISFFGSPSKRPQVEFLDDEEETLEDDAPLSDTRTMTKDDIAAEVQRLINGAQQKKETVSKPSSRPYEDTESGSYYDDRSTRQQLLNETTQMRAQLDDYEDNLNDVNDRMKHTNQILNIVLIILIIALALVLAVVIYWVLLSKGVIS